MTTNELLNHFCPATLARLAAEIIANHAAPSNGGRGLEFDTEASFNAYIQIVAAGGDQVATDFFFDLIDEALAREAAPPAGDDLPDVKIVGGQTLYLLRNNLGPILNAFGEPIYATIPTDED